ncbi:hypothetical protein C6P40_004781, partial [Pichia californica]
SLKTFKATPILATLLALSGTPSSANAAPIIPLMIINNDISTIKINTLLNFLFLIITNLLNITFSTNSTPLYSFKALITALNWILISIFKNPISLFNTSSLYDIVPLFDNRFMIYTNTLIVLISATISVRTLYNNKKEQNEDTTQIQSNIKHRVSNFIRNYNTF